MKKIWITGVAGTGKSATSNALSSRGYESYDIEGIDGLFSWVDIETKEKIEITDKDDLEKLPKIKWICDKDKLVNLLEQGKSDVVFYAGIASNNDEIFDLFDQVILLQVSNHELKRRLTTRTSNDFARTDEAQERILSWKDKWEDKMLRKGAVAVDADKSLEGVVDEIIELTK